MKFPVRLSTDILMSQYATFLMAQKLNFLISQKLSGLMSQKVSYQPGLF